MPLSSSEVFLFNRKGESILCLGVPGETNGERLGELALVFRLLVRTGANCGVGEEGRERCRGITGGEAAAGLSLESISRALILCETLLETLTFRDDATKTGFLSWLFRKGAETDRAVSMTGTSVDGSRLWVLGNV